MASHDLALKDQSGTFGERSGQSRQHLCRLNPNSLPVRQQLEHARRSAPSNHEGQGGSDQHGLRRAARQTSQKADCVPHPVRQEQPEGRLHQRGDALLRGPVESPLNLRVHEAALSAPARVLAFEDGSNLRDPAQWTPVELGGPVHISE